MRSTFAYVVAALCLASPSLPAQSVQAKKITTVEGITEYRLANGLKVLIFPDPSKPTVTVNLTVLVGSRHEGYGETGMAHLLEHMVFKGTPSHRDIPKLLRDHGATFNGTTNYDRTNYFETMPATDENLEVGIRMEADRLVNSFVRREDLISEMTVVRSEFEQGENSPERVLNEKVLATAYEWHNYGKSTIGNRTDIERVPIDNLKAFYKKFYQPDNCVLILAGKLDEAKAMALTEKYFGAIPRPERELDKTYTEEPPQDGDRTVILRRVGSFAAVGLCYHIVSGSHPDFPACEVLETALTSEPSGRLYQAMVVSKKATSIIGDAGGFHDPGVIEFGARCEPGNLDTVRDMLIAEVESVPQKPVSADDVERAKRKLVKNHENLMNDSGRVAVTLSNWAAKGDWRLFFLHRDRLEQVTAADVNRVAAHFLKRNNRTLGLFIPTAKPERVEVASAPPIADMLKGYKGRNAMAAGETFDPSPENIDARTRIEHIGGIKAALLPRKTRGEAVTLQLSLRYGNEESLRGQSTAASILGSLLTRGTKNHSRQQIQDELDKLGARMVATGTPGHLTVSLIAKKSTLPQAVALLGEILRSPTLPDNEFDQLREERREALEKAKTDPGALASRSLGRKLSPKYEENDPRYLPTIDESLARLNAATIQQVRDLYSKQLNGNHGELAVVGDFDVEPFVAQMKSILSGWNSNVPYQHIVRKTQDGIAGEKIVILTPDKANAIYAAGLVFAQNDQHPDVAALEMGNFLLGGGTLASRLGTRVRQKDGLSYGVRSSFNASAIDPVSQISIQAICNPANMGKLDNAIQEEVNKFLQDGVTPKELEDGKKAMLEQFKLARTRDQALVGMLAENLYAGRNFSYYADIDKKIAALTPEQIRDAYRKRVAVAKLVVIHAGDFKQ